MGRVILIHPRDNVAVVCEELKKGMSFEAQGIKLVAREDIPKNHKVAVSKIALGKAVIKYGESIGIATKEIEPGEWVHTHNLKSEEN